MRLNLSLDKLEKRYLRQLLQIALLLVLSQRVAAITITNLTAPVIMDRPSDNAAYSFPVTIRATIDAGDFAGGLLPLVFRSSVGGVGIPSTELVDARDLEIPPGLLAGTLVGGNFNMFVGCSTGVEVFGPAGMGVTTGLPVLPGEFYFPTLAIASAVNHRVECLVPGDPMDPPAMPTNGPATEIPLEPTGSLPPPYPPYPGGLIPQQLTLAVISSPTPVPEPTSIVMLSTGALCLLGFAWRRAVKAKRHGALVFHHGR